MSAVNGRLVRLLWLLPSVLAAAYFAFWACAPTAYLRTPLAADEPKFAVGGAAVASGMVNGELPVLSEEPGFSGFDGQVWFQHRFRRYAYGADVAVGQAAVVTGGGFFRTYVAESSRAIYAIDFNLGALYAGLSVPVVARFSDGVFGYVAPSLWLRATPLARLPLGMRFRLSEHVHLNWEAGIGVATLGEAADDVQAWGALGLSFPFGVPIE